MLRVVTSTYMIICLSSIAMKNEFLLPKIKMNRKLITKYFREMGKVYVRSFYVEIIVDKINYLMLDDFDKFIFDLFIMTYRLLMLR